MRNILLLILLLSLGIILQLTVVGRIQILSGSGDLILVIVCALASQEKANYLWLLGAVGGLVMGFISAAPWYIFLIVYMILIKTSLTFWEKFSRSTR